MGCRAATPHSTVGRAAPPESARASFQPSPAFLLLPLLLFPVLRYRRQLRPQSGACGAGRCASAGRDALRIRAVSRPRRRTMKLRSKAAALLLLALAVLLLALLSLRARGDPEAPGFPARPEAAPQHRHAPVPTRPPEPRVFLGVAGRRSPKRRPLRPRPRVGRQRAASREKLAR